MAAIEHLHVVHVVCTKRIAGVERYVGDLARAFTSRGHQATVISRLDPSAFLPPGPDAVPVRNWRAAARRLRSIAGVDVVHTHLTEADVAGAWALRGRATPLVATRHFAMSRWSADDGQGSSILRAAGPLGSRLARSVDERVDVEIAVSRYVAEAAGGPCEVIHPGVDPVHDVAPTTERPDRMILLQRLESVKATELALDAWALADARTQGWTLGIHGDGRRRDTVIAHLHRLGLDDSVELHGHCDDVASVLASAAVLIAPAHGEPFGMSVVEAMAAGVPVIATAAGGHLETVGTVPGAVLVAGDAASLAAAIDRVAGDPDTRARVAAAQLEVQRARLTLDRHAADVEAVYRTVIEARCG
jgi:glycosyltransferase involved in cell wall biosynthesis